MEISLLFNIFFSRSKYGATPFFTNTLLNGITFTDADIIWNTDPNSLESISIIGLGEQKFYDKETEVRVLINLFLNIFTCGTEYKLESQVNEELEKGTRGRTIGEAIPNRMMLFSDNNLIIYPI